MVFAYNDCQAFGLVFVLCVSVKVLSPIDIEIVEWRSEAKKMTQRRDLLISYAIRKWLTVDRSMFDSWRTPSKSL